LLPALRRCDRVHKLVTWKTGERFTGADESKIWESLRVGRVLGSMHGVKKGRRHCFSQGRPGKVALDVFFKQRGGGGGPTRAQLHLDLLEFTRSGQSGLGRWTKKRGKAFDNDNFSRFL